MLADSAGRMDADLAAGSGSPLSPAQRRLWFLQQLRPADPAYTVVTAVRIDGPLGLTALATATAAVTARHPALRATVGLDGDRPVWRVKASGPPRPELVDLTTLAPAAARHWCERLLRELSARPFDLGAGPVARWTLLRLTTRRHVLVFCAHHAVFDGGSLPIVRADLQQRYAAALHGRPAGAAISAPVPDPDRSDAAGLAYWAQRLAGAPDRLRVFAPVGDPVHDWAHDPAGAGVHTVTVPLGRHRAGELRTAAGALRCTPFMLLLAVFGGLLSRYSGRSDLVVGTPVALRDTPAAAGTVGLFVNMLALRLDLGGDPPLAELLRRLREDVLDALQHRAVPFELVVDELRPPRDPNLTPLFQVVFGYQRSPLPPELPGTRTSLLPVDPAAPKYALTVLATELADDIELTVQAAASECDLSGAQLFAANLDTLLGAALHDPRRPLSRLPLLGAIEPAESVDSEGAAEPVTGAGPPRRAAQARGPRGATELAIATAWHATLQAVPDDLPGPPTPGGGPAAPDGRPGPAVIDVHTSFFDLGGSSLLLLRLLPRLHSALGALGGRLTLADLFRFPTVAGLAAHLDGPDPGQASAAAGRGARRRDALTGRPG